MSFIIYQFKLISVYFLTAFISIHEEGTQTSVYTDIWKKLDYFVFIKGDTVDWWLILSERATTNIIHFVTFSYNN